MVLSQNSKDFNFCIPLDVSKASNGDWRIKGLASTEHLDLQGEIVRQNSLDITPLKEGRGLFNWDHQPGANNILGVVDKADLNDKGLLVEGYLFKNSDTAKSVYGILSSLKDKDKKRLQMSIEGKILRRAGVNGKEIAAARIDKVALTFDPVNPNTYAELVKSLTDIEIKEDVPSEQPSEIEIDDSAFPRVESSSLVVEDTVELNPKDDCDEMIKLVEVKEIVDEVVAKAKKILDSQIAVQTNKAEELDRIESGDDWNEVKKSIKEKIELFIKSQDPIVGLGVRILQLWEQTGIVGNLYEQEQAYYQLKEAVDSFSADKIIECIPYILQIWRDEGLGIDEVESKQLYAEASKIVGDMKKALSAGNCDVAPGNLTGGAVLQKESLKKKSKKKKKKEVTKDA